jgi:hypothetical protein
MQICQSRERAARIRNALLRSRAMYSQKINRISAIAPMAMSFAAFLLVLAAVTTGWGQDPKDEGGAAHVFQLLIALQIPFILAFLVTADWSRLTRVAAVLSVQVAALVLAFAPVAYFKL